MLNDKNEYNKNNDIDWYKKKTVFRLENKIFRNEIMKVLY